jgi:hypothetical protein
MKLTARAVVIVLISMMTSVVFAQTTSSNMSKNEKPAAATLTAAKCQQALAYMATHSKEAVGLKLSIDSVLFVALFENGNEPIYTSVEEAGTVAGRKYATGDSLCAYITAKDGKLLLFSYPIRSNAAEAAKAAAVDAKLKLAAARAHAVEELNEGRPRSGREIVASLSDGTEVTIPEKMSDDFGWSVVAGGTYQMGKNRYALGGELGIRYTTNLDRDGRWFLGGQFLGGLRKSFLNDNAEGAGDTYMAYGTSADMLLGVTFGKHRQFKVAVSAGLNWEWYKTDSQRRVYEDGSWDELSSWGNYLSPEFLLHLEYRGVNWPVYLFGEAGVRQFVSVWQNEDSTRKFEPQFRLGVGVPIFRHVTNNK